MKSATLVVLVSLTLLALLLLLDPAHSAPVPSTLSYRYLSSSQHLRRLLSRNDSRHDIEERIENSNEQQARDMQQQYQHDREKQQKEAAEGEEDGKHSHHTTGHDLEEIDRDAVVTGDDLRHPRDPKQQQKQQQQVINNGTTTPPPSKQREDRRDDEADKADQAADLARSAEEQRQDEAEDGEQLVEGEVSNGTNMTMQNNGSAPADGTHPYNHNTQKAGMYNGTLHNSSHGAGPYNGTSEGRLDQASPYHNTDPQSRTWSQQRQNTPPNTPANFTAPLPPNSTYPSPLNPPPYDPSHPASEQQQPPVSSYNGTGHDNSYTYPQPVPSVDHAQRLVDEGKAASESDVLEGSSGSDADDEFDSQATQNSSNSGATEQSQQDEEVEGSTAAMNGTGEPVQEPGNNVQWNVLSEAGEDEEDDASNTSEDIRDKQNGGNRLRNEPRADSQPQNDDERDTQPEQARTDEAQPTHESHAEVDMVDVERAVSGGGDVTAWLVLLVVLCAGAMGAGWWLRRVQRQQKYEPVEQYDAYGDVVEGEESEMEYERQSVQVRVY